MRQKPGDPEAAADLAISLKTLEAADEEAEIATLLEKYGQASAGEIAAEMLAKQRAVKIGMMEASTNTTPGRIDAFENLANEQQQTADLWIPLKRKLLQAAQESGSDESRMAELNQQIESTREAMKAAASQLQDLETTENAQRSEMTVYQIWKAIAPYESVLQENIRQQSNNIERIRYYDTRTIRDLQRLHVAAQQENQTLTPLFRDRFEQMLEQGASAQAAPGDGGPSPAAGAPEIPPEDIETIRRLTNHANTNQLAAVNALKQADMDTAFMTEQAAYSALREIEALLPKPPPQDNQQEQSESESPEEQPQEQTPENTDQEEQPEDTPDEDQNQPEPESGAAEEEPSPTPEEDMLDEEVENLLQRALQREREHEQERREKLGRIPLAPSERDW